uniref:Uncharacterized protein n=1 Tax=Steinernema glaseri TaxID=37863 RepID=A0A1I7ZTG1_9BILA
MSILPLLACLRKKNRRKSARSNKKKENRAKHSVPGSTTTSTLSGTKPLPSPILVDAMEPSPPIPVVSGSTEPRDSQELPEMTSKENTKIESVRAHSDCKTGVLKTKSKSMTKTNDEREEDSFASHVPVKKEAKRTEEIRSSKPVDKYRDDYKTLYRFNLPASDFENTMSGVLSVKLNP